MDVTRILRPLALATAASMLLAAAALWAERGVNQSAAPERFLPAYAANIAQATRLEITHGRGLSGTSGISATRGETGWSLGQRWNYPANDELVTETLLALADIDVLEARTAQSDWHRALGLVVPEELGKAIRFRVVDAGGDAMVTLLLGKDENSEAEAVQKVQDFGVDKSRFYVRLEDSPQSWLASGRLPRNAEPAAWIDPSLPRHTPEKLAEISFKSGASGFKAVRVGTAWSLAGTAAWLDKFRTLRPDDVARADSINFDTAQGFTLVYDDGLRIIYDNLGAATVIWSRMRATTDKSANAETKKLAAAINARFNGWALRFSAERTPVLLPAKRDLGG